MKIKSYLLLMLVGGMTAGCQSINVATRYNKQIAFADFHAFCWVPAPAWLHNDPRLHMDIVEPIVQHDIEAQLLARGFRSVDCATADFQVTFTASIQESLSETPGPESSGIELYQYTSGLGGEWFTTSSGMNVRGGRVVSLVILIRDPRTNHVLWQGKAAANLPPASDDAQREQRIETAVRLILEKFPPPASK